MADRRAYSSVSVLVVGAGPAGLAAAIKLKTLNRDLDVCVIDKAPGLGQHSLSGAVLEAQPLFGLLDEAAPGWQQTDAAKEALGNLIDRDDILFLPDDQHAFNILWAIKMAKVFHLGFGQMQHAGDYSLSLSRLVKWMGQIATGLGVEILAGFAAKEVVFDPQSGLVTGVKLADQGLDKHGAPQPNHLPGETIQARMVVLAEGCDGLVTEQFVF